MTGSRLQDLDEEMQLQAKKVQTVSFIHDSAEAHYRLGLASELAALETRKPVIAEQLALLDLNGQRLGQEIALVKALGGGYRAKSPAELKLR